ncbi:MAG: CDP-alcohol phosphatidyltransferase family protein [Candidatus Diapherotrites archaeon]|nr:CDP-alcohol phosphatidyltransferase family protein [Candidatus Diapherotrites archaeon]
MIKGLFDKQLVELEQSVGRMLSIVPLSPNQWTLLAVVLGFSGFLSLVEKQILLGGILFSLSFLFDIFDGSIAKYLKKQTPFGDYFDGLSDILVDFLLLVGLWSLNLNSVNLFGFFISWNYIIFTCILGVFLTSFAKSHASYSNPNWRKQLDNMHGLIQRGERCMLFVLIFILLLFDSQMAGVVLLLLAIAALFTVLQRFVFVFFLGLQKSR